MSYYVDLAITQSVPIINTSYRVPVFIDFCTDADFPFLDQKHSEYYDNTGTIHLLDSSESLANRFFVQESDAYYSAILYFHEGIVHELEIINWNGQDIDHELPFRSDHFKKIFRYNDDQIYNAVASKEHLL